MYLSLHCHDQNDGCIKMGSDKSHFNVLLIVKDKVTKSLFASQAVVIKIGSLSDHGVVVKL